MKFRILFLFLLCPLFARAINNLDDIFEAEDLLTSDGITRGLALVPKIKAKTDTLKIGLDQNNSIDGVITIGDTGSYCINDNIVSDIVITGTNVLIDINGKSIVGTIHTSASASVIKNGAIVPLAPRTAAQAATPAIFVHKNAKNVLIKRCHIECYDSSLSDTTIEATALAGRSGIEVQGDTVNIYDCSLVAGSAADTTQANAQDGGTAIILSGSASQIRILDCIMLTGNGGTATNDDGGNGGHGIHVKDTVSHVEIAECTIFGTGHGGDGDSTGGDGGHGIQIDSTAVDVGVHHSRIRNTGAGGSPSGVGGKAVLDSVTTSGAVSVLFSNFAHNISNAIKFDLAGTGTEKGILSPNPPTGVVINSFANVYVS